MRVGACTLRQKTLRADQRNRVGLGEIDLHESRLQLGDALPTTWVGGHQTKIIDAHLS